MAVDGMQPFTLEEHRRFMDALETEGVGTLKGKEWERIASFVGGSRSSIEVKLHAFEYLRRLTQHSQSTPAESCKWSAQEDSTFEQGLSTFEEGDENRWEKIAAMLPGKTAEDVRQRYTKLILDITRIENGEQVMLMYEAPSTACTNVTAASVELGAPEVENREQTAEHPDDVTISTLADDMTKSDEKGVEGAGNVSIGPTTDAEDGEEGMDMSVMTRAEGEGDNDGNDGACKAVSEINFTDTKVHEDEQLGLLADAE